VRRACVIAVVVGTAIAAPAVARAHTTLVRTRPADGAVLARAPGRVLVVLDDQVRVAPGNAAIRNGGGSILAGRPQAQGRTLVLPLRRGLGDGDYSVRWSVVSDDGHIVQGVLAFGVGLGRPPPAPALRPANELGFESTFARLLFFAGLLVASGLALFDVLVWRPVAGSGLGTGWIAIGLGAVFVSAHGLVHVSHGGSATRFGLVIEITSAVAATGAAAAAIAFVDRTAAKFALVPAIAVLAAPTFAGHALDPGRSWIEVPVDLLHTVAAAIWIGGLFALALVVPRVGAPPEVVTAAARRFSRLALAAVVVLVATGAVRALSELSAVSQLWTTSYGRAILVKTGIFAVLVGAATVSRSRVSASLDRLRPAVTVELVLAFGIVVAVSVLTALRPGRH
jgi:copper transport protein